MLSDHEREALVEIEHRLLADDPEWIMTFDAAGRRVSRQRAFEWTFQVVALAASVALTMLMVAAHAPGPALFFATVAGLLAWLVRGLHRARKPAGSPGTGHPDGTDPSRTQT